MALGVWSLPGVGGVVVVVVGVVVGVARPGSCSLSALQSKAV